MLPTVHGFILVFCRAVTPTGVLDTEEVKSVAAVLTAGTNQYQPPAWLRATAPALGRPHTVGSLTIPRAILNGYNWELLAYSLNMHSYSNAHSNKAGLAGLVICGVACQVQQYSASVRSAVQHCPGALG